MQEFGCWTADLERMARSLEECRIDTVLVQATGVYWIARRTSSTTGPQGPKDDSVTGPAPRAPTGQWRTAEAFWRSSGRGGSSEVGREKAGQPAGCPGRRRLVPEGDQGR